MGEEGGRERERERERERDVRREIRFRGIKRKSRINRKTKRNITK